MQKMVKDYAALAGIKKRLYPFLFRKSAGTELTMMTDISFARFQQGYLNPKTTLNHYFIPNDNDMNKIDDDLKSDRQPTREELVLNLTKKFWKFEAFGKQEFLLALQALRQKEDIKQR